MRSIIIIPPLQRPNHTFIFISPSPPIKHCLPKECLISFHRFSPEKFLFMGQAKKKEEKRQ